VTGWQALAQPPVLPEVDAGYSIQVTWVDANAHWVVFITRQYPLGNGKVESREVHTGHYGPAECPTGYQALMLALSDWRHSS
jgi:hypothetical protein